MPVHIYRDYMVVCDAEGCTVRGLWIGIEGYAKEAYKEWRKRGWKYKKGKWYCAKHTKGER